MNSGEVSGPNDQGAEGIDGVAVPAGGRCDPVPDARAAVVDVAEPEPYLTDGDVSLVRNREGVTHPAGGTVVLPLDECQRQAWVPGCSALS